MLDEDGPLYYDGPLFVPVLLVVGLAVFACVGWCCGVASRLFCHPFVPPLLSPWQGDNDANR